MKHNDIIFVSMENWDDVWRRNQFVCAELARRYPAMKLLYVGVQRNIVRCLAKGDIITVLRSPVQPVPDYPSITFTRPLRVSPERFAWGSHINEHITRNHLRALAKRLNMQTPILWLNPHYAIHLVGQFDESAVIYDITDDWISISQKTSERELTRQQDAELCRRADAVVVCSKRLYETKQSLAKGRLHLVRNGVDADHYASVLDDRDSPLPPETAAWPKPVFGYTGTVHPDRVDVDLVVEVAQRLQSGSLVFVGPNMLPATDQSRLLATSRVILHGPVPYARIPSLMRAFDVWMSPHRMSEFVESLNPIKLWEYLAAGKPIVSTDVAGFRDYPRFVRLARSAQEFAVALKTALSESLALAGRYGGGAWDVGQARRAEARRHSWSSRVDQIEAVIEMCLEQRKPASVHVA